jgi:signal transduction histidine kinase
VPDAALRTARKAKRDADPSLDVCRDPVQIMETHLWKIVEELVDNACKFSPAGAPIEVTGRVEEGVFTLAVLDKGRGMTAAQIADVGAHMQFERRIHEQQGSGLGLAIARRLAELYGGDDRERAQAIHPGACDPPRPSRPHLTK